MPMFIFVLIISSIKFQHIKEEKENKPLSDISGLTYTSASHLSCEHWATNRVNIDLNEIISIKKLTQHQAHGKHSVKVS